MITPIKELEIERTYSVTVNKVWDAWTKPEQIKLWWGPDNVSIPECEVDLRVGGKIYIVMEAGEAMGPYKGTRWPMEGTFTVVEENSRLAYEAKAWTEDEEGTTKIDQITELTMYEDSGKTVIKLKATINKTGPDAKMAIEGMQMGFNQQFDKLNKFLSK
jgi:uncharacterized protein YndB with AHSA1/START domain